MSKDRKPVSAGIGDSKPHVAPPGSFDENPTRHAGGRPVGTGALDYLLASAHSDEQQAENDLKPKARTTMVRDAFEKQTYDKYADERVNTYKPWMTSNPMQAMADQHTPTGHVPRFLGERKTQIDGLRGWQPVIGSNGDPVKLGSMTLASMPREEADERNKFFRDMDADKIRGMRDETSEQTSRLANAKGMRVASGEAGFKRSHGSIAALDE